MRMRRRRDTLPLLIYVCTKVWGESGMIVLEKQRKQAGNVNHEWECVPGIRVVTLGG